MSDELKCTPGPWEARGRVNAPTADCLRGLPDDEWGFVIWMPRPPFVFGRVGAVVATAVKPSVETEANAHLIAAAPELYEALLLARSEIEKHNWEYGHVTRTEQMAVIDAALAKARGEQ
jgi:hypothetical protein